MYLLRFWEHFSCVAVYGGSKLSDFIRNILICVLKMNKGLTGLERHEVLNKVMNCTRRTTCEKRTGGIRFLNLDSAVKTRKRRFPMTSHSGAAFSKASSQTPSADSTALQAVASGSSSAVNQVEKGIKKMKIKDPDNRSSVSHTRNERLKAEPRQTNKDPSGLRYLSNFSNPQKYIKKVSAPFRGLLNEGATCYLNATLQVLFMTEAFRERVLQGAPGDTSGKLVSALKELFENLKRQDGGTQSILTRGVIQALGIQNVYEQRDAVEYFLDILEKVGPNLAEVFRGTMRNNRTCSKGHKSHDDSSFKSIQIALKSRDVRCRLEDGLQSYFKKKDLVGDDQMYCDTCKKKSDTKWDYEIHEYPTILALHLERFVYDYRSYRFVKNDCLVDIPLQLPLKLFQEQEYCLYAVINHSGSRYGGHYTADIRSSTENKWYCFNDSHVTETDKRKLKRSKDVCFLLYQKNSATQRHTGGQDIPQQNNTTVARFFPGQFGKNLGGGGVTGKEGPHSNFIDKCWSIPICFLNNYMKMKPKASEELTLLQEGMGCRTISITEDAKHSQLPKKLKTYSKMAELKGACLLHEADGGSGQIKWCIVPPESERYMGAYLKTVAGGKSTLFNVPGSLDTLPPPYSDKEFEKIQNATRQTCLDNSTNKQNEHFQEFLDNRDLPSTSTAMDIMLKNVSDHALPFGTSVTDSTNLDHYLVEGSCVKAPDIKTDYPIVKIHANFGGESFSHGAYDITKTKTNLQNDTDGTEILPKQFKGHREIKSFISIADVIKSLAEKVDKTSDFSICITRGWMLEMGLKQWQQQKKSSPKNPLRVIGEAGTDNDTLRKDFLTEMMTGIEKQFFEGGENGKTPKYSMIDMDKHNYKTFGEIFAVSIAQGGPPPNFFMEWCYNYISTGEMDLEVISERDVTDPVLMELIKEIKEADNTTLMKCRERILLCGYTEAVSIERKEDIVRSVVLHATVRLVPILQQICSGMKLYGLLMLIQQETDICRQLFVPGSFIKVDPDFLVKSLAPVFFSEKGTMRRQRESRGVFSPQDFVQDIEDEEEGKNNREKTFLKEKPKMNRLTK